jgi:hypothetical protein
VQRALLFSLVLFFANRAWNYYDKIVDKNIQMDAARKYWSLLLLTSGVCCFFLGFAICLELVIKTKRVD